MQESTPSHRPSTRDRLRASFTLLGFGIMLLAFLVAIERPQWFKLRPASGTAAALSKASIPPATHSAPAQVASQAVVKTS
ncbi:hypothetical protein U1872_01720 [Sphingomonas sp. RB3P16]|uniref:hypothetical protein n=1 Tax=Parasphingomonas frigoris TaxID=3096163 RepID=UPI002FCC44D1